MPPKYRTKFAARFKSLFGNKSRTENLQEDEEHGFMNRDVHGRGIQDDARKFRLLIIGKSGCGKTTILSKVCGEEVADKPSTTRGTHNIEKEMEFADNELFIVHDSEGFEAGQEDEYQVVANFIKSRGRSRDINTRLHAIWYCLTTNSRPIQDAEEKFFSEKHDVPIVAVFTKFDLFIENELQELMENCEELEDEAAYHGLERQAEQIASDKFEKHFKETLLRKPYPPQAVVALQDVHNSKPSDPRLTELIGATMTALRIDGSGRSQEEQEDAERLASLFAAAQQADLPTKYTLSMTRGLPNYFTPQYTRHIAELHRFRIVGVWSVYWNTNQRRQLLMAEFQKRVEEHPLTFGNLSHQTARGKDGQELTPLWLQVYQCLQLAADFTVIMTEIFLLKIEDEESMREVVAKYTGTAAFAYIQEHALKMPIWTHELGFGFHNVLTASIVDGAVHSSLLLTSGAA